MQVPQFEKSALASALVDAATAKGVAPEASRHASTLWLPAVTARNTPESQRFFTAAANAVEGSAWMGKFDPSTALAAAVRLGEATSELHSQANLGCPPLLGKK